MTSPSSKDQLVDGQLSQSDVVLHFAKDHDHDDNDSGASCLDRESAHVLKQLKRHETLAPKAAPRCRPPTCWVARKLWCILVLLATLTILVCSDLELHEPVFIRKATAVLVALNVCASCSWLLLDVIWPVAALPLYFTKKCTICDALITVLSALVSLGLSLDSAGVRMAALAVRLLVMAAIALQCIKIMLLPAVAKHVENLTHPAGLDLEEVELLLSNMRQLQDPAEQAALHRELRGSDVNNDGHLDAEELTMFLHEVNERHNKMPTRPVALSKLIGAIAAAKGGKPHPSTLGMFVWACHVMVKNSGLGRVAWLVGLVLLSAARVPVQAQATKMMVDAIESRDPTTLLTAITLFAGSYITSGVIDYFNWSNMGALVARTLQTEQTMVMNKLLHGTTSFFNTFSTGYLGSVMSGDISRLNRLLVQVVWKAFESALQVVLALVFLGCTGEGDLAFTSIFVLLVIFSTNTLAPYASQRSVQFGKDSANVLTDFLANLRTRLVTRTFDLQPYHAAEFEKLNAQLFDSQSDTICWSGRVNWETLFAMQTYIMVMTVLTAVRFFYTPGSSVSTFTAQLSIFAGMLNPAANWASFGRVSIDSLSSMVHLAQVREYRDQEKDGARSSESGSPKPWLPPLSKLLRFDKLHFTYPGCTKPTLKNFSVDIPFGQYVGVVGTSGAGKSTIINLLLRFFTEQGGAITVDGRNIDEHDARSLRDQIGAVFQDSVISNATIRDNIREGKLGATNAEVVEAATKAGVHEAIMALPMQYDTLLGDNSSVNVSGGQAQRICLARALCRKPRILILDEATSALDPETQAEVVRDLCALRDAHETTIISITHRLSTVRDADQILVLDAGHLAEQGTFQQLAARKGIFHGLLMAEEQS